MGEGHVDACVGPLTVYFDEGIAEPTRKWTGAAICAVPVVVEVIELAQHRLHGRLFFGVAQRLLHESGACRMIGCLSFVS